jgi:hypothetical protein
MKIFRLTVAMCLLLQASWVFAQAPVGATCVKLVNKSCEDVYGSWPGPNAGGTNCEFLQCETDTLCTTGEVAAIFWNRDLPGWQHKHEYWGGVPSAGEQGRTKGNPQPFATCKYMEACMYECFENPMNGQKRCRKMHRYEDTLTEYTHDFGVVCPLPQNQGPPAGPGAGD